MDFPNRERVSIEQAKLTAYLLSDSHPIGKTKAAFFRAVGFDTSNPLVLEQALRTVALHGEVKQILPSPHGTKYVVTGKVETPSGRKMLLQTVWILEPDQDAPRFVTAYPG